MNISVPRGFIAVLLSSTFFVLPGCSYVKGVFGWHDESNNEPTTSLNSSANVLSINQKRFELDNESDLEESLIEIRKIEDDIEGRLREINPGSVSTYGTKSLQEAPPCQPVFKNSDTNCPRTTSGEEKRKSVFIQ